MHAQKRKLFWRCLRSPIAPGLLLFPFLTLGCIELGLFTPIGSSDSSQTDGGGDSTDGDATIALTVRLSVSNPTPQINEEVTLRCSVSTGDANGIQYTFDASPQPGSGLSVNRSTGRASFIVSETDLNISFRFSCTGTNDLGQTASSSTQSVTPTGV